MSERPGRDGTPFSADLPEGASGLPAAVEAVTWSLDSQEALTPQTLAVHAARMRRFASFARAQGMQILDEVSPEVARAFVHSRRATGEPATESERCNRLFSIRRLYKEARKLGLASLDPTVDIRLPRPRHVSTRPLTDEEIEVGRSFAVRDADTRPAVCWSLAEATARTSEIPCLRVSDLDFGAEKVWIHGGRSTDPRLGTLTGWGNTQIQRRLRAIDSNEGPDPVLIGDGGWDDPLRAQNAATCVLRLILRRSGLTAPGVNPMSIPAWAGTRAMADGASIDEVARLLGLRSLDGAAALVAFHWHTRGRGDHAAS